MRNSTKHLLQRLSLWVLGQALPETGALRAPARLAVLSVVGAAAAGTLLTLGVAAGLVGLYLYLIEEGLSPGASTTVVAGIALLAGLVAYLFAHRTANRIPDELDELKLFSRQDAGDILGNGFNLLVGGFLEGLAQKPEQKAAKHLEETREDIENTIEQLLQKLEALEGDRDDEDAEAEVVLELKGKRRK